MRLLALVSLILMTTTACGSTPGHYTRDADEAWIDNPAMSTGLDKRDLDRMFVSLASDFLQSPFYVQQSGSSPAPSVAIAAISNDTTEHIDVQLRALMAKMETQFVKAGGLRVISRERQAQLIGEIDNQQGASFDPIHAAKYGRLVGTEYLVVGKVFDAAERTSDMRRVQYMAFLQVISVDTGEVVWQDEADVTKAFVAGR